MVSVGSPESSPILSLRQVTVEATSGGGMHREVVYLSSDGRHIFRDNCMIFAWIHICPLVSKSIWKDNPPKARHRLP